MPRKSKKQTEFEIIFIIVAGLVVGIVALWNFLVETKLIWAVPVIIVAVVVIRWYLKKRNAEKQAQLKREAGELKREAEEQRIANILSQRNRWGEEMCQWLIEKKRDMMLTISVLQR